MALTNPVAGLIVADGVERNWFEYELLNVQRQLILSGDDPADVDRVVAEKEYCMHRLLIEKASPQQIVADRPSCAQQIQYPVAPAYMQQVAALNVAQPWTRVAAPVLVMYGASDFVTSESDHRRITGIINQYHPGSCPARRDSRNESRSLGCLFTEAVSCSRFKTVRRWYMTSASAPILRLACRRERCLRRIRPSRNRCR